MPLKEYHRMAWVTVHGFYQRFLVQYSHVLQVVLLKQLAPHNAERKDVSWRPISLETTHFRTPVPPGPLELNLGVLAQSRQRSSTSVLRRNANVAMIMMMTTRWRPILIKMMRMRMRTMNTMRTLRIRIRTWAIGWTKAGREVSDVAYTCSIVEPSGSRLPDELTCCEGKGNSGERAEKCAKAITYFKGPEEISQVTPNWQMHVNPNQ